MTTPSAARIAAVLAQSSKWTAARRKSDGKRFFYIPGSKGAVYMTAADGCTCPAAQRYSGPCKHSQAVAQHEARQTAQTQPARRRTYNDLIGDDDDKPFCTPCNRHHDVGAHYTTVAAA